MKLMKCSNNHFYDGDVYQTCPHCKNSTAEDPKTEKLDRSKAREGRKETAPTDSFFDTGYSSQPEEPLSDLKREIDDFNVTEKIFSRSRLSARAESASARTDYESERTEYVREKTDVYEDENVYEQPEPERPRRPVPQQHVAPDDEGRTVKFGSSKGSAKDPLVGWLVGLNGEVYGEGFPLVTGRNYIGRGADMDVVLRGDPTVSRNKHAVIIYEPKGRQFLLQPGESKALFYLDNNVVLDTQVMKNGCELCIGDTRLKFVAFCGEDFSWETNA